MKTELYVGLGSNLNDPQHQILSALAELAQHPAIEGVESSSLYRSRPMGPSDQPPYINAVARMFSSKNARSILQILQQIEQQHGRKRGLHWGPRTLDLDLLLYGNQRLDSAELQLPHPGIRFREFVLYPLFELNPFLIIPGQGAVSQLMAKCYANGIQQLSL